MKIFNRKYRREYESLETYEAGIVLTGGEVKSIKEERMNLDNAFVKIMDEEAYMMNAEIAPYEFATKEGYDPLRRRKLLLHKSELIRIKTKLASSKGLTLIPVSCYNKGYTIKVEIALSRGRRDIEKRKFEKGRDIKRNEQRMAKEYMKK